MERIAHWLDGAPPDGDDQTRSFERALVLIVGGEYLSRALHAAEVPPLLWAATLAIALTCAAVWTAWRRGALVAVVTLHFAVIVYEFPATGNHAYLELLFLGLLAFLDPERPEERRLFLNAGRWVTCVVLIASGLQKVAQGYYGGGQYFTYKMGTETYRTVLAPLLPAEEAARAVALDGRPGAGPYLSRSPLLLMTSRAVVLAEMALPPLLLVRATRTIAVVATLAVLLAIEAAAREVFFGLVMVNATLLFGPPSVQRGFVPFVALLVTSLLLVRLGLLPPVVFN